MCKIFDIFDEGCQLGPNQKFTLAGVKDWNWYKEWQTLNSFFVLSTKWKIMVNFIFLLNICFRLI